MDSDKKWIIRNTLNHPVYVSYGGETATIPPKGRFIIDNKEKVGALPSGVSVIPFVE